MINGDTHSASAGQHALLHGLLRFQIELGNSCTCSNVTCGDYDIVMTMGDTRSASAGQHALLHGLLRFQIELGASCTCSTVT